MFYRKPKSLLAGLLMATVITAPAQAQTRVIKTFEDGTQLIDASRSPLPMLGGVIGVMVALAAASGGSGGGSGGGDDDEGPKRWLLDAKKSMRELYNERLFSDMYFIGSFADRGAVEEALKSFNTADRAAVDALLARDEYKKNPVILNHGIAAKHAMGLTGKGVVVAVADDGFDRTNKNLSSVGYGGEFNPHERDFSKSRPHAFIEGQNVLRHGTIVAQVLAGADDGDFNLGVAPGVTLHNVHVAGNSNELGIAPNLFGKSGGLEYIANNKIDIVNGSFAVRGGPTSNHLQYDITWGGHLLRAINNGTIFVFATGNDALPDSDSIMVKMGLDPRTNGQLIAVAALDDSSDQIAEFSNHCGTAKYYCISAVGNNVPVLGNDGHSETHHGTSMAAPVVSGSLALLKEQFPELAPEDLVELLFVTADDLGAVGVDDVYGRGALNLGRAFRPVGDLRLITGNDLTASSDAMGEMIVGNSLNTKIITAALEGKDVVLVDDFDRGFATSLSSFVVADEILDRPIAKTGLTFDLGYAKLSTYEDGEAVLRLGDKYALGYGAVENMDRSAVGALRYGYDPRGWISDAVAVAYEPEKGPSFGLARSEIGTGANAAWAGYSFQRGDTAFSIGGGYINEKQGFMGASFGSGQGSAAYVTAGFMHPITDQYSFGVSGSLAKADYKDGQLIKEGDATLASLKAHLVLNDVLGGIMTLTLGTPLHVTGGSLALDVATARNEHGSSTAIQRGQFTADLSAANRPIDFGLKHEMQIGKNMGIEFNAAARHQDGNTKGWIGLQMNVKF